jgi:hypothetical protein
MKKVYIEWNDAWSYDPWTSNKDAVEICSKMMLCKTIGWVLDQTADFIIICHSYNDELQVTGCLNIPMSCVKKVEALE